MEYSKNVGAWHPSLIFTIASFAMLSLAGIAFGQVNTQASGGTKTSKVYTNEDLSPLNRNEVSVVGHSTTPPAAEARKPSVKTPPKPIREANGESEREWRSRARGLRDQMAALDGQIARVRENIAFANGRGYDIHTDVLDLSLRDLLQQKADIQRQMDSLAEDARKAGAEPGWLR